MDFRESDYDVMSLLERLADPNPHERNNFIDALPHLKESEFFSPSHRDDRCPICQETFLSCIALEEMAYAMDTPAMSPYDHGVTKLPKCGHVFCIKDISKWIISAKKDTCPTCRTPIGLPAPPPPTSASPAPAPSSTSTTTASPPPSTTSPPNQLPEFPDIDLSQFGLGRAEQEELMARLRAQFTPGGGGQGGGNFGESPYQYDDDRSEFSGMYS